MNKKVKLLVAMISLLAFFSLVQSSYAFKFSNNVAPDGAPVAGGVGATAVTATPGDTCVLDKCNDLRLQIKEIQKQIDEEDKQLEAAINNLSDPNIDKLRGEINQLQNKSLSQEEKLLLSKKILELVTLSESVNPDVAKLKNQILDNKVQIQLLKEQMDKIAEDADNESNMDPGQEEDPSEDDSQTESDTDSDSYNFEYDVNPLSYSLQPGDLVAWGIPGVGVPYVPRVSAPQHQERNVTEKPVSDEAYNALRVVETESVKITDSDKDTFLMQLNSLTSEGN